MAETQANLNNSKPALNWHEDFIIHLASLLRPRVYIELGIQRCSLFNRMIPYAERLIGVDIDPTAGSYMQFSDKTFFVHAASQDFAKELSAQPITIDMLFIDADHSQEEVLKDFKTYFPFVAPHGMILLHDVHPGHAGLIHEQLCGTAYLAAQELSQQTEAYEMVTIPVSPGLAICRKRKIQLSWQE